MPQRSKGDVPPAFAMIGARTGPLQGDERMTRNLLVALAVLVAASACARNGGQVASDQPVAAPTPSASPSPAPPSLPVELEGSVNNIASVDLTSMGTAAEVEIEMADFSFNPTFVKLAAGANLKLSLKNEGALADHTFTVDALSVDTQLKPAEGAEIVVQLPMTGTFRFYCRLHADRGMQGAFYFDEGASAPVVAPASTSNADRETSTSAAGSRSTARSARSTSGSGAGSTAPAAQTGSESGPGENQPGDLFIPDLMVNQPNAAGNIGGTVPQNDPVDLNAGAGAGPGPKPQTGPTASSPAAPPPAPPAPSAPANDGQAGAPSASTSGSADTPSQTR